MSAGTPLMRAVLLCAAALTACSKADVPSPPKAPSNGKVEIGALAPNYSATSLAGDTVSLVGQRGKVVLLNVWATWCHPCRTEIPELRALHERYRDRGLSLVGVSVDAAGTDTEIRAFMNEFKMTYDVWRDPDDRISAQFLLVGVPGTFLIDKGGVIRWKKVGAIAPGDSTLRLAIDRALATE